MQFGAFKTGFGWDFLGDPRPQAVKVMSPLLKIKSYYQPLLFPLTTADCYTTTAGATIINMFPVEHDAIA